MKIYNYEEDRFYSLTSEETEKMFSDIEEQREYGFKSKALGVIAPGAYQAKEAAKYASEDEDEYKNGKKYLLKGSVSPITATYVKKHAEKMAKEGASPEEIRKYLNNEQESGKKWTRRAAGTAEAVFGLGGNISRPVAYGVGIYDKLEGNRAEWAKKEKSSKKSSKKDED